MSLTITIHKPLPFGLTWPLRRKIPCTWKELKPKHAIMFVRLLFQEWSPGTRIGKYKTDFRINFLRAVMKLKGENFYKINELAITQILDDMRPIFDSLATYPALQRFLVGFTWYYLPRPRLAHMTMFEFAMVEECYRELQTNHSEKLLNHLVSHLCRPRWRYAAQAGNVNDLRQKYDSDLQQQIFEKLNNPGRFEGVPHEIKLYVYFFYHNCREQLVEQFPKAFRKAEDAGRNDGPDFTSQYGWLGVINVLAENGIFGTWDDVCMTEVHKVLHTINFNQDKALEAELNQRIKS